MNYIIDICSNIVLTECNKEMQMNAKIKIENLHYSFISVCVFIFLFATVLLRNPDLDSYFLINTGEIILRDNSVPIVNTWVMHEGYNVIVQQWLACIIN